MRFTKIAYAKAPAFQKLTRANGLPRAFYVEKWFDTPRRGMTLVELLVVVMIMVILLGIALPAVKPALEDRKVREASRQLNAFLRAAQMRAAEINAPAGVWIARTDNADLNIAYQLYFAETPPPYVGDLEPAQVTLTPITINNSTPIFDATNNVRYRPEVEQVIPWANIRPPSWLMGVSLSNAFFLNVPYLKTDPTSDPLIKRGDIIRFNYTGPDYVIYDIYTGNPPDDSPLTSDDPRTPVPEPPQAGDLYAGPQPGAGQIIFGPGPTDVSTALPNSPDGPAIPLGSRFQIFRQPQRSTAGSLSLPNETAIDLSLSGIADGINDVEFGATAAPIKLMFRPDGAIDRVYVGNLVLIPDGPIHFLVGRSILDENQPDLTTQNLNDQSNLWVSLGHRTGAITTAPMQDWTLTGLTGNPSLADKVKAARQFARSAQSVGGL